MYALRFGSFVPALRRAGLYFAAGLFIAVLSAWAFALWSQPGSGAFREGGSGREPALAWPWSAPEGWPDRPDLAAQFAGPGLTVRITRAMRLNDLDRREGWTMDEFRAGWPFRSLRAVSPALDAPAAWRGEGPGLLVEGVVLSRMVVQLKYAGSDVPESPTGIWVLPRQLPLLPIWPGLLANTALAAAALAGLSLARRSAIDVLRRRRGLCPSCGYPRAELAGAPCPECGRP